MSDEAERAPRGVFAGILICSVGVLMAQVLLTRIFSFTILTVSLPGIACPLVSWPVSTASTSRDRSMTSW